MYTLFVGYRYKPPYNKTNKTILMDEARWVKVETIIDEALDLPPAERDTFIQIRCKDDLALKSEVTQLLESILNSQGWLENPVAYKNDFYTEVSEDLESISSKHSLTGKQVGAYSIKEQIGEGGMGSVYLAERSDKEFQHSVAIKIIRHGRATTSNIQRFKREQQILADLNHPGIATLHDGGVTDDGFLYIIMEYVDGLPIDEYCRQNNTSIDDKIALFKQVLQAVRHAHENLVIHRDLKPENILVNQSGNIKILDFGISKLLQEEDASLTQTGVRLLTPKYAAPEQIREANITTGTDLYALGIIFYELLAGVPPYNFEDASQHEIEHTILQNDPSAPSSRVGSAKLKKKFRGDLDAIVLKAIRKEPEQRYRVANDFLSDLENYRKGLPVTARQDSVQYRSKKFLQRHKQSLATVTGILLLFIGFAGFYTWRVAQERNQARFEAQRAEEVKNFMLSIFNSTNPDLVQHSVKDLTPAELLASGIKKVERELKNRPVIYIELMVAIGSALENLDDYETGAVALNKALIKSNKIYGPNSIQSANILRSLAGLYNTARKTKEAQELAEMSISILKQKNSPAQIDLAHSYSILAFNKALTGKYREARKYYLTADSLYIKSSNKKTVARHNNLDNLAEVEERLEEYELAESHFLEALQFYKDHYNGPQINITHTQSALADLYSFLGEYKKATQYLTRAAEIQKDLLGKDNAAIAATYSSLGLNYWELRELDKALKYIRKSLSLKEKYYGSNSMGYASELNNIAMIQETMGEYQEARNNYKKSIQIKEQLMEPDNTSLAISYYNFGSYLNRMGNHKEAITFLEKAIEIDAKKLGTESVGVAIDYNRLATISTDAGKYQKADTLFKKAWRIFNRELPEDHKRIAENLVEHGKLKLAINDLEKAQMMFREAKTIYDSNFEKTDIRIQEVDSLLSTF